MRFLITLKRVRGHTAATGALRPILTAALSRQAGPASGFTGWRGQAARRTLRAKSVVSGLAEAQRPEAPA